MMFIFGGICMIIFEFFVNMLLIGKDFNIMLVYVWYSRNNLVRMNLLGMIKLKEK
jgi:Derlin-2/3